MDNDERGSVYPGYREGQSPLWLPAQAGLRSRHSLLISPFPHFHPMDTRLWGAKDGNGQGWRDPLSWSSPQ